MLADLFDGLRTDLIGGARGLLAVIGLIGLLALGAYLFIDAVACSRVIWIN
jgi:hypothetical protein